MRYSMNRALSLSLLLLSLFAGRPVAAAETAKTDELPKGVGRLWNLTNEPFTYQIARTSGQPWSGQMTLAPGKYQEVKLPKPGETSEWLGLDNSHHASLTIRFPFPQLGGTIRIRLPGRTASDEIVPNWLL